MPADPHPQVVIPPGGDRPPVGVPQQLPVRLGVPLAAVLDQAGHQRGGDRLPADRLAFFPQPDQALVRVQVPRPQGQRAATAARGFGMQAEDQRVQLRIVARRRGDVVDLRQPVIRQCAAGGRQASRFGYLAGRVVGLGDQSVVHGALVQAAQRGHQVLFGAAPAAGVTAGHHVGFDVAHQLPDL